MKRACTICGAPTALGNRCAKHAPKQPRNPAGGRSPGRDRTQQAQFRAALMQRAQGRCEDCGNTTDLRATHIIPLASGGGYALSNGRLRCKACDMASDRYAR
jgi:5-methylcytosine-specific restriction endonuclease McrA